MSRWLTLAVLSLCSFAIFFSSSSSSLECSGEELAARSPPPSSTTLAYQIINSNLDAHSRSYSQSHDRPLFNASVCGITSWEAEYLDEWIIYHRLMGVQHFYLYDYGEFTNTFKVLSPYIERGIVTLHTMAWKDGSAPNHRAFQGRLMDHCQETYGNSTEWLFHFDSDEFLRLSQLYRSDTKPTQIGESVVTYPLHDYLLSPAVRSGRCLALTRNGEYVNVGVVRADASTSVLDSITYRKVLRNTQAEGKVALRGSKSGLAAAFNGAHDCIAKKDEFDGLTGAAYSIRNAHAIHQENGMDPIVTEPLMLAHYEQRSLENCLEKMERVTAADNWRLLQGGPAMCYREFVPSMVQDAQNVFASHKHAEEIAETPAQYIVLDEGIRNSWYGQHTIALHAYLKRGNVWPSVSSRSSMASIKRLIFDPRDVRF